MATVEMGRDVLEEVLEPTDTPTWATEDLEDIEHEQPRIGPMRAVSVDPEAVVEEENRARQAESRREVCGLILVMHEGTYND
jgi:hypothetical protein